MLHNLLTMAAKIRGKKIKIKKNAADGSDVVHYHHHHHHNDVPWSGVVVESTKSLNSSSNLSRLCANVSVSVNDLPVRSVTFLAIFFKKTLFLLLMKPWRMDVERLLAFMTCP